MRIPDGVRETRWPVRHTAPGHLMTPTSPRTARLGRARVNVTRRGVSEAEVPAVFSGFTPEGKDLVRRVLASCPDLEITITDGRRRGVAR